MWGASSERLTSLVLFTFLEIMHMSPWTAHLSCSLCPQYSVAVVRSNLWPGACAYATGK